MRIPFVIIISILLCSALLFGCKKKDQDIKSADDAAADTDADTEKSDSSKAETSKPKKGKAVFPPAPANNFANRQAQEYVLSIKKAQIIPSKVTAECWDDCNEQSQTAVSAAVTKIEAIPPTSTESFDVAAKLLQGGIGLVNGEASFPDVFLHLRCGHGQGHKTQTIKDKFVPTWQKENKKLLLDERDECVISLWDHDDDGDEEIGRTAVPLVQRANAGGGKAVLFGATEDFGAVYSVEIGLTKLTSSNATAANNNTSSDSSNTNPKSGTEDIVGTLGKLANQYLGDKSGSDNSGNTSSSGTTQPSATGAANYTIEIVKAQIKTQKKDGKDWDASAKKGMLGKLGAMAGGKKADVFVEAWVNGYKSQKPFMYTETKKENHYPVWNKAANIQLRPTDHINFMVWDGDLKQHDLIGECKTKPMGKQYTGDVWIKKCGQVDYLLVKITKK